MALNIVARGGSVVYFGLYGMDFNLEVNLFNLYWKDASISCVCVPSGYFPAALAMAGQPRAGGGHHSRLPLRGCNPRFLGKGKRPSRQSHAGIRPSGSRPALTPAGFALAFFPARVL